ncbi:MAG TPA: hypothetical protein VM865_09310 [Acidobacteriaceae bacterium]|jgi:hypothetical protein|nr:hypothetical protein [Acidobacteriaceae bacterium]
MAWKPSKSFAIAAGLEVAACALFLYEERHFAALGYSSHPLAFTLQCAIVSAALLLLAARPRSSSLWVFAIVTAAYAIAMMFSIKWFPLNYLRSDMLPVIAQADQRVLQHGNPYAPLYLGTRQYDFPYLPGMIVAYLPISALRLDLRIGELLYTLATAALVFWATCRDRRADVAGLLAVFLLSPFLQFRHDLYIQPHWMTMIFTFVLMQRRRFAWAALVFGTSMAIYQFSWILLPFLLLNGLRRRGWPEVARLALLSTLGALMIAGPFLQEATHRIAINTVSQWSQLPHAVADAMNLSYWATYILRPGDLLPLQAMLMVAIFSFCLLRGRCADLPDTLRWMSTALIVFVLFNVVVDGYFFLMILIVLLAYICAANGWWEDTEVHCSPTTATSAPAMS